MRRLFALVAAVILLDTMFYAAIAPLLPTYADDLGLSKTAAGILSASYAAGTLLASIPAGFFAARVGVRAGDADRARPDRGLERRLRVRRRHRRPRPRPVCRGRRRGLRLDGRADLDHRLGAPRAPRGDDRLGSRRRDLRDHARPRARRGRDRARAGDRVLGDRRRGRRARLLGGGDAARPARGTRLAERRSWR